MKKMIDTQKEAYSGIRGRVEAAAAAFAMVFAAFLLAGSLSFVSWAATGTVTATSAKIRREASTSSDVVGSTQQGKTVDIIGETTGADGMVWYQINVDANTTGYIRSDLVSVSGEVAPVEGGETGTGSGLTPSVEVTQVQPLGASVSGEEGARARADASVSSEIIKIIPGGAGVTINGMATGTDGNIWYQVTYDDNGTAVQGFVRSDYLTLAGEPVALDGTNLGGGSEQPDTTPDNTEETPVTSTAPYEVREVDGKWCLVDLNENKQYVIESIFTSLDKNVNLVNEKESSLKRLRIIVAVLAVLFAGAAFGVVVLILKLKDMKEDGFIKAVEKETMAKKQQNGGRPRSSARAGQGGGRQTAGAKPQGAGQARPAAGQTRPAAGTQAKSTAGSNRPAAGAQPRTGEQSRTAAQQSRTGASAQGTGSRQSAGQRQGTQPRTGAGTGAARSAQAGVQTRSGEQPRTGGQSRTGAQPRSSEQSAKKPAAAEENWKPRNFANDEDDDFEFEFLSWNDDEKL